MNGTPTETSSNNNARVVSETTREVSRTRTFEIESAEFNLRRLAYRIFARIDGRRYEFVRMNATDAQTEVYDFPASWEGVSRFCGYAPAPIAAHLETLARAAA